MSNCMKIRPVGAELYTDRQTDEWKDITNLILCFVGRASLYNLVNKANVVHNFS